MIVIIDNYDSFTYNLVQYLGELGQEIQVHRNDAIRPEDVRALNPNHIVVSPGPCTPREAGVSKEVIEKLGGQFPILGVCLGHQCIGEVYGGEVVRAENIMHGKVSQMAHTGHAMFEEIDSPFEATRYHSLIIRRETCPEVLEIVAQTDAGEIMAVAHRALPVWGVQFHPESILTTVGKTILSNFLKLTAPLKS